MTKPKIDLMFVLPNIFTAASIFFAVLSIFKSVSHDYLVSLFYIIVSLICDGLDGRVARAVNRASKFGVEFDSLADIVAFGVAPALLFYFTVGHHFERFGQLVAALFVVFGAIRLARFNITTGTYEPNVFIGLPIPTAAVVLSLWTCFIEQFHLSSSAWAYILIVLAAVLAFLMVSNIRYPSFKKLNFSRRFMMKILIIAIFVCSLIYLYPLIISVLISTSYVLYGIVRALYNLLNRKLNKN